MRRGDFKPLIIGQAAKLAVKKQGGVFVGNFPLMVPAFSVCLSIPEAIISVKSLSTFYPWL